MAFIETVPETAAQGPTRAMYDQVMQQFGYLPNWARVFSLRPAVRDGWVALLSSIRSMLSVRTYELATLAAARALHSSYCALAHGKVLADQVFDGPTVQAIVRETAGSPLTPAERAMMDYARKIVVSADKITPDDIQALRDHGFKDEEIFDIAAAAAARCFFSKLLDALGVQADERFNALEPELREALTVGRPVATE